MQTKEAGLLSAEFEKFVGELTLAIADYREKLDNKIRAWLRTRYGILSKMSDMQFDELCGRVDCRRGLLWKEYQAAKGTIGMHLADNDNISAKTIEKIHDEAPAAFVVLNNPAAKIAVKKGNQVVKIEAAKLGEDIRKVVVPTDPKRGILLPSEQNEPRPFVPDYFKMVSTRTDPDMSGQVLIDIQQGRTAMQTLRMSKTEIAKLYQKYCSK